MPRLTVLMPARNAERTIHASISSCLRALPNDAELRIWDDGSSDNTMGVASSFDDPRVSIVQAKDSIGGGRARIALLAQSDSEFIASMDADDICLPWRFSVQQRAMSEKADILFGSVFKFKDRLIKSRPSNLLRFDNYDSLFSLLVGNYFSHPTMLAKRSLIDRVGGYSEMRRAQDYELWLRAAAHGAHIVKISTPVLGYRLSESQVSSTVGYEREVMTDTNLMQAYLQLVDSRFPTLHRTLVEFLENQIRGKEYELAVIEELKNATPAVRRYLTRRIPLTRTFPTRTAAED